LKKAQASADLSEAEFDRTLEKVASAEIQLKSLSEARPEIEGLLRAAEREEYLDGVEPKCLAVKALTEKRAKEMRSSLADIIKAAEKIESINRSFYADYRSLMGSSHCTENFGILGGSLMITKAPDQMFSTDAIREDIGKLESYLESRPGRMFGYALDDLLPGIANMALRDEISARQVTA
jgi:hypothetical protein